MPTMSNMCWYAFEHSLLGKTRLWLKETEKNKKQKKGKISKMADVIHVFLILDVF